MRLPIQFRLTLWYLLSLAVIIALFSAGSWYAMRASMYHSIDNDLSYRIDAVIPFIQSHGLSTPESFSRTFTESSDSSIVGVFVQITDVTPRVLYESHVLSAHSVPVFPQGRSDGLLARSTITHQGWTVRLASKRIKVNGAELTVHVVEPLSDLLASLHEFTIYFALIIPVALLLTALTGYWISKRALAPVEQIRREADGIDPTHLTARLHVLTPDDELGRLAGTLNSMLARIEAGFRSVERFTADASHELRAPLAFIITAGDVSLRRPRTREELADALGKIVAEARRMSKLVESLLSLARGDAKMTSVAQEPIDLNSMARETVEQMAPAAAVKQLEMRLTLPPCDVQVCGLPSDLRRLLLILLDNAIKYTDTGTVSMSVTANAKNACIAVSDTGIGIEPAALPQVFERFWRADKARSRAAGGAGLGLSLAHQIVQQHRGTITIENTFGAGCTFTVELPAIESVARNSYGFSLVAEGVTQSGMRQPPSAGN